MDMTAQTRSLERSTSPRSRQAPEHWLAADVEREWLTPRMAEAEVARGAIPSAPCCSLSRCSQRAPSGRCRIACCCARRAARLSRPAAAIGDLRARYARTRVMRARQRDRIFSPIGGYACAIRVSIAVRGSRLCARVEPRQCARVQRPGRRCAVQCDGRARHNRITRWRGATSARYCRLGERAARTTRSRAAGVSRICAASCTAGDERQRAISTRQSCLTRARPAARRINVLLKGAGRSPIALPRG